jgi:hypothetical protein
MCYFTISLLQDYIFKDHFDPFNLFRYFFTMKRVIKKFVWNGVPR